MTHSGVEHVFWLFVGVAVGKSEKKKESKIIRFLLNTQLVSNLKGHLKTWIEI